MPELRTAIGELSAAAEIIGGSSGNSGVVRGITRPAGDLLKTYTLLEGYAANLPDQTVGQVLGRDEPGNTPPEDYSHRAPGTLYPGTTLHKGVFLNKWQDWAEGQPAESRSTPIARLEGPTPEEWALLTGNGRNYLEVSLRTFPDNTAKLEDEAYTRRTFGLDLPAVRILRRLLAQFETVVRQDGERGGLGDIELSQSQLYLGTFNPAEHNTGWHADSHKRPAVRYVASFGQDMGTQFVHGPLKKDDLNFMDDLKCGTPEGVEDWSVTTYPAGTIARFPAKFTVHSTPAAAGPRLFMTASIYPKAE